MCTPLFFNAQQEGITIVGDAQIISSDSVDRLKEYTLEHADEVLADTGVAAQVAELKISTKKNSSAKKAKQIADVVKPQYVMAPLIPVSFIAVGNGAAKCTSLPQYQKLQMRKGKLKEYGLLKVDVFHRKNKFNYRSNLTFKIVPEALSVRPPPLVC